MWSRPSNTEIKVIDHDKCAACEHVVRRGVCVKCGDRRYFQSPSVNTINALYTLTMDMRHAGLRITQASASAQKFGRAFRKGAKP